VPPFDSPVELVGPGAAPIDRGVLLVVVATLGLSLKGIWARLGYAEGLEVHDVVFYRSLLALPILMATAAFLRGRFAATGSKQASEPLAGATGKSTPKTTATLDLVLAAGLGLLFAGGMWADFQAIDHLGAGRSRVILFGFPLVVMLLHSVAERRLPPTRRILGFTVAWCGLLLVAWPSGSSWDLQAQAGLGWSLLSMLTYGVVTWLCGKLTERLGSVRLALVSNLATACLVIAASVVLGGVRAVPNVALLWIGAMVVLSTVVPYFLLMEGIRRLGSPRASVLSMVGPPCTLAIGWVVLGESLSLVQALGSALTLAGVGIAQLITTGQQVPSR